MQWKGGDSMSRRVGTTVLFGVVFLLLGSGAAAQVPPTDAHDRTAQPVAAAVMSDAHQRAPQATPAMPADAHDRVQPIEPIVVVSTDTGTDLGWTRTIFGVLVGAAFLIGLVWLTITVFGTHHRHPPVVPH